MNSKVTINVGAQADLSEIEKEVNSLGRSIAASGGMKFTPISVKDLDALKEAQRRVNEMVKVSGQLRQKLKATGQEATPFTQWDWERMHPHAPTRNASMRQAFRHVFGNAFSTVPVQPPGPGGANTPGGRPPEPPGPPPPPPPKRPGDGSWGGMAGQVAQAGLRGAGPVGNVAANAVGTGMAGGIAAGAMGLLGGMLALGVGKLISSAAEKLEQAEINNMDTDQLKRVMGDVGVSFGVLKGVLHSSADQMKVTYGEAGRLGSQFAKLANLTGAEYKTIGEEVSAGVGLSRSFGLETSQGVGTLAAMRGLGITKDTQETRRFALLIGETIGKSDAFARAGEVMDAIAGYASMQTRSGMGAANVAGYAGMYSAMVGSGLPGMDTQGTASLLARINASLAGGGAKGEASQFFTTSLGSSLGLTPYQIRSMREHGAFATADQSFGKGSVWERYYGRTGPGGSTTLLQGTMDRLRKQYGDGSDELVDATANHLGIGFNQAMGLLTIKPNQMGEMQRYAGDLTKMSGKGIGNLSKALYGSAAERRGLADDFLTRQGPDAISAADRKAITDAGGDDGKLREVLGRMAANYDQERTTGSDIRDTKNLMDNLKTAVADKLVPFTQDIRAGVLHLAGKGQKTGDEVLREIAELEAKDRTSRVSKLAQAERERINGEFEKKAGEVAPGVSPGDIFKQDWHQEYAKKLRNGTATPEEKAAFEKRVREYEAARLKGMDDPEVARKKRELDEERMRLLKGVKDKEKEDLESENKRLRDRLREIDTQPLGAPAGTVTVANASAVAEGSTPSATLTPAGYSPLSNTTSTPTAAGAAPGRGADARTSLPASGAVPQALPGTIEEKLAAAERATGLPAGVLRSVIHQETGGKQAYIDDPAKYHYGLNDQGRRIAGHTGKVSTAFGPFGILESTAAKPGYGVAPLKDKGIDEQIRFASQYLAARARSAGSLADGLAGYGEGSRYSRAVLSRMQRQGTPMPAAAGGSGAGGQSGQYSPGFNVSASPMDLRITFDSTGKPIQPPDQSIGLKVNVGRPSPFGLQGPTY